jgi:hypothetical protein
LFVSDNSQRIYDAGGIYGEKETRRQEKGSEENR